MPQSRSTMRLFNGELKIDEASVKKIFLMQLSNIFCIKTYLLNNLPIMAGAASFVDLKTAIMESIDEIKLQLIRMEVIYKLIGEQYHPHQCLGIETLTREAYTASKASGMSNLETDLTMLYHLISLESLEITSFTMLHDLASLMPQDDLVSLLKQNLDLAKDSKELYEMIIKEYVH